VGELELIVTSPIDLLKPHLSLSGPLISSNISFRSIAHTPSHAGSHPFLLHNDILTGGRDNFFHCDTCGACYSTELRNNHVCVPNSMQQDCPICCEFLFDSLEAPQVCTLVRMGCRGLYCLSPLISGGSHPLHWARFCVVATLFIESVLRATLHMAATRAPPATRLCATCVRRGLFSTKKSC